MPCLSFFSLRGGSREAWHWSTGQESGPAPSCCHLSPPAQPRTPHLQLWLGPPALGSLREQGSGRGWSLVLLSHGERGGVAKQEVEHRLVGLHHYLGRGAHTGTTRQPLVTSTQECQFSPAADFTQILASGRGARARRPRTSLYPGISTPGRLRTGVAACTRSARG